ncbi:MAG: hypothetical protein ABSD71_03870 [Bacteroidales bacterium]|jgi:hypothetical protein
MAIVDDNILLKYRHGKLGNEIYRVVNGKTVVSKAPDYSKIKWSQAQKENRTLLAKASAYAREAIKDPEKCAFYEKKKKSNQNAFNVAVAEFMLTYKT